MARAVIRAFGAAVRNHRARAVPLQDAFKCDDRMAVHILPSVKCSKLLEICATCVYRPGRICDFPPDKIALRLTWLTSPDRDIGLSLCQIRNSGIHDKFEAQIRKSAVSSPLCDHAWRAGVLALLRSTGKPAFDHIFGVPIFQHWAANPERARIFDEAMASRSAAEIAAVLSVYDFSDAKQITDIGGGSGAQPSAIS